MLYKQAQLFKITQSLPANKDHWQEKLEKLAFRTCQPAMTHSLGWGQPVGETEAPLVHILNSFVAICFQIEEKILPSIVIQQKLREKIKQIETREERKIYQKEKNTLKDELTITLLPKAFTKLSQVHAYIDLKNQFLVLATTNPKRTEQFITLFKKTFGDVIEACDVEQLSQTLTHWLQQQSYPRDFAIEKSCVLQDQKQKNRIIRCQQQDLFATSIQTLIKDGCQVKQIALEWQDNVNFVLAHDFSLTSIRFKDELIAQTSDMEAETEEQKFIADFFLLTETLSNLFNALLKTLTKLSINNNVVSIAAQA